MCQETQMRAKFKVEEISFSEGSSRLKLSPITCGSRENDVFFDATPYGEITIGTVNTRILKNFSPGVEVYVDFAIAEKTT